MLNALLAKTPCSACAPRRARTFGVRSLDATPFSHRNIVKTHQVLRSLIIDAEPARVTKAGTLCFGSHAVSSLRSGFFFAQKILILGGTGLLGPPTVQRALERGHIVTLFNRGKTGPDLFPTVENIRGDRQPGDKGDLSGLAGDRKWDAVIDVWPSDPAIVTPVAKLLANRTHYYFFVSTISVYADYSKIGIDETAPTRLERSGYGGDKARSEKALQDMFSDRVGIVRPSAIMGPRDDSLSYHFWLSRLAKDEEIVAPGTGNDAFVGMSMYATWRTGSLTASNRIAPVFTTFSACRLHFGCSWTRALAALAGKRSSFGWTAIFCATISRFARSTTCRIGLRTDPASNESHRPKRAPRDFQIVRRARPRKMPGHGIKKRSRLILRIRKNSTASNGAFLPSASAKSSGRGNKRQPEARQATKPLESAVFKASCLPRRMLTEAGRAVALWRRRIVFQALRGHILCLTLLPIRRGWRRGIFRQLSFATASLRTCCLTLARRPAPRLLPGRHRLAALRQLTRSLS
jgi:NAD dependent epimerase/dehydratase family